MADVQGRRVKKVAGRAGREPGSFEFVVNQHREIAGLKYRCPCGCGSVGLLPFRGKYDGTADQWDWDGNEEKPTLQPSVHHTYRVDGADKTHWHGWLRGGIWSSV